MDEPNAHEQSHSTYAQNLTREILEEALPYLNIYPDEIAPEGALTPEETDFYTGLDGVAVPSASGTRIDEDGTQQPDEAAGEPSGDQTGETTGDQTGDQQQPEDDTAEPQEGDTAGENQ